jgi:hypothetical protein
MAFKLHFPWCALPWGADRGPKLLSWTKDAAVTNPQTLPEPKPKSKHSLLPILVVLFLISYGLMSLLAVEQDRTIASQRWLITSLLGDSTELSNLKGKLLQKQYAKAQAEAGAGSQAQAPSSQDPSTQDPSTQSPSTQSPKAQDTPAGSAQRRNLGKMKKGLPQRPPLGMGDIVDGRRIVKSI